MYTKITSIPEGEKERKEYLTVFILRSGRFLVSDCKGAHELNSSAIASIVNPNTETPTIFRTHSPISICFFELYNLPEVINKM
jgi:hypothetical protein